MNSVVNANFCTAGDFFGQVERISRFAWGWIACICYLWKVLQSRKIWDMHLIYYVFSRLWFWQVKWHFVKAQISVKISKYHKFLSMIDMLNMYPHTRDINIFYKLYNSRLITSIQDGAKLNVRHFFWLRGGYYEQNCFDYRCINRYWLWINQSFL